MLGEELMWAPSTRLLVELKVEMAGGDSQPGCGKCPAGEQTTPGQRGAGQPRERT